MFRLIRTKPVQAFPVGSTVLFMGVPAVIVKWDRINGYKIRQAAGPNSEAVFYPLQQKLIKAS